MRLCLGRHNFIAVENFKPARLFDGNGDLSKRWFVFYYFQHPETREYIRFREWISQKILTRSGRRDEAQEMIRKINARLYRGFDPFVTRDKQRSNICDAIRYVIEIKKTYCRPRTYHTYSHLANFFLTWLKKTNRSLMLIEDFTYLHAQEFMDYAKKTKGITNRTYNYQIMHMHTFFQLLVDREWIPLNPFQKIKKLEVQQTELDFFSDNDRRLIREKLPDYNYDLYIVTLLIYFCFLRPAEIMRLRIRHLRLQDHKIMIPGSVSKNKKSEVVMIPEPLAEALKKLDLNYPDDYYIFTRHLVRGTKEAAPTRIAEYWRTWAKSVGIDKKIYHLKHTGIGRAIQEGINPRDLQLQLRHSSLEITQIYLEKFNNQPSDKLSKNFPPI